jgi:hypothetical protein
MDQIDPLTALTVAVAIGILALLVVIRRQRRDATPPAESMYAASTEGEKRCPKCSMGNLWTDRNCISCGARLPG